MIKNYKQFNHKMIIHKNQTIKLKVKIMVKILFNIKMIKENYKMNFNLIIFRNKNS